MRRSGSADMPLHYGHVPPWLANRMATLGLAIVETIIIEYGKNEVVKRLSDPFWFQSLGAVMGMDLDVVVGGFEVVDVFQRNDLDLAAGFYDYALLLDRRLSGGFEEFFGDVGILGLSGACARGV